MENNTIISHELEQMRSQIGMLKQKLEQQTIVNDRHIRNSMKSNISDLNSAVLLNQDATQKIKISEKINLLFMDPPYQTDLGMLVLKKKLPLAENAIIILEVEKGQQVALPDDFYIDEERNYGRNQFLFIYPKRLTK